MRKNLGKTLSKITAIVLLFVVALTSTACGGPRGGGSGNGNKVEMTIAVPDLGHGTRVVKEQVAAFNEAFKDKEYTDTKTGVTKTGVNLRVAPLDDLTYPSSGWEQETHALYHASTTYTSVSAAADNEYVANIDSIIRSTIPGEGNTTILDKIPDVMRYAYRSGDDYYGLPLTETIYGVTYDVDLFDKGFYFAGPDAVETEEYESEITEETYYFVNKNEQKSVGPNGKSGDYDDGLPSSLFEFIALCEYLDYKDISPFVLSGKYPEYFNYFVTAMMDNLFGKENAEAQVNFTSSSMNVVVEFLQQELFPGYGDIKMPVVTSTPIKESSGYYTTMALEKYVTGAFVELANTYEWFSPAFTKTKDHLGAQADFIFGIQPAEASRQGAMLCEGSYWYNESTERGKFVDYKAAYRQAPERNFAWMPLPVNIFVSVDGTDSLKETPIAGYRENSKGDRPVMTSGGGGALVVNKIYENDALVMEAVKDYLLFITSDKELVSFALNAGYGRPFKYTFSEEEINAEGVSLYAKNLFTLRNNADVTYHASENQTFSSADSWTWDRFYTAPYFENYLGSPGRVKQVIKDKGAMKAFTDKIITIEGWNTYYKNESFVPTYEYYNGQEVAGNEIVFKR